MTRLSAQVRGNSSEAAARGPILRRRAGFTLVEVLAALLVIAIVLPSVMSAISLATTLAGITRDRNEATTLAQLKLNDLILSGNWQTGNLSGDFGTDQPRFHWSAAVSTWDAANTATFSPTINQLDVSVTWTSQGRTRSVTLSTLLYSAATTAVGTSS